MCANPCPRGADAPTVLLGHLAWGDGVLGGRPVTAWSLTSVSLLAHGVHYALVGVGLVGVSWLLLPQLVGTAPSEHDRRVAALRARAAAGSPRALAV